MRKEDLIKSKINVIENIILFTKKNRRKNKLILAMLVTLGIVVVALKVNGLM